MVDDIRTVAPEDHWKHFEKAWTTLLTYRYLGKGTPGLDKGVEASTMVLRHDMRNSTGGIMAAPLCIASPEPDWPDDECVPAPVTMSYDVLDPARDVRQILVQREVINIGRAMGFSRSRIVDADDPSRVLALSTGNGVTLGDVPGGYVPVDNPICELEDSPDLPALRDVFGVRRGEDGALRIQSVTPELASPHGALHLGPINIALEAAVTDESVAATQSPSWQVLHWMVQMIKPGLVGPFRATARVFGGAGDHLAAEATMIDEGRDDRIIATVSALFGRVAS
jgi:hypothetical protein